MFGRILRLGGSAMRAGAVLAAVMLAGVVAACSSSKPGTTVTVTKTASRPGGSPSASTSASTSVTTTSSASHQTGFSGTCDTLLPDGSVFDAIGVGRLPGEDAFVVGQPEPNISRLAYLNCRYGVTGSAAAPAIEIGISLYSTAADATTRITATVDDYTAHGASTSEVTVSGLPAKMLTGGVGDGYAVPLLVVASGQRTVAVSVAGTVATGDKAVHDATALASLALERTGR